MINSFNLFWPDNITELLDFMKCNNKQDIKIIAGGTDLIPQLKKDLIKPDFLLDISRVFNNKINREKDRITINPMVTHQNVIESSLIRKNYPVLIDACEKIGSPQIRNTGTVVGNIVNASPAADCIPPLMVLNSCLKIQSNEGENYVKLNEFFEKKGKTKLNQNEIVTKVFIPDESKNMAYRFFKLGKRKALSISIVNGAIGILVKNGKIKQLRIALGAVAPIPMYFSDIERITKNEYFTEEIINEISEKVIEAINPIDDIRASASYRRKMVRYFLDNNLKEIKRKFDKNQGG